MASVRLSIGITEEDIIRLSANQPVEVVNGKIIPKMAAHVDHSFIIENVHDILKSFVSQHQLGYVFGDGLHYKLHEDAEGVKGSRIPDVSFVRKGRITRGFDFARLFPGAPDLA